MSYLFVVLLITAPLSFALFMLRLAKLRLRSVSFSTVCKRITENVEDRNIEFKFNLFQNTSTHVLKKRVSTLSRNTV